MSLEFSVRGDGPAGGRQGRLRLPHGAVETPVFMPVGTSATVKAVEQGVLERMGQSGVGAQIILANTYHLYLRPGHELIRRMGGVHRFMGWERPMLTDSGGFQVFSLAKLRKVTADGVEFRSHLDGSKHFFSPEHSMAVQIALGADVMMVFDECVETPATWGRTRESMGLTHAWAVRSKEYFEAHKYEVPWGGEQSSFARYPTLRDETAEDGAPGSVAGLGMLEGKTQALFGIVQGGMYPDLRRESAERLMEMDFPGYAIGGLAVGEPREVTREMIARTLELLPSDKPRYVMGVGYPDEIEEYARMGVDMMDCVLPTRAGRHGLLFRRAEVGEEGTGGVVRMNIKRKENEDDGRPVDAECGCLTCKRYSRAYLRHLFVAGEPLGATLNSVHNLQFYLDTMERVRRELADGMAGGA
jgi:queuine tRNA-ribosyltransferase